jgi:exoribonuclease-2
MAKTPSAPAPSNLGAGSLCLYENDGRPFIGVCLSLKNQKFTVLNNRNREVELPGFRLHKLKGLIPAEVQGKESSALYLAKLFDAAEKASLTLNLEELWSTVVEAARDYSSDELGEVLWTSPTLENQITLRLALVTDRIFFKRGTEGFSPRPIAVVDELKRSERSKAERVKAQELALAVFAERQKNPSRSIPAELQSTVHTLLEVAAGCPEIENNRLKEAKDFVDFCAEKLKLDLRGSRDQRMIHFLESTHLLTANTNLAFIRHRFDFERTTAVHEASQNLPKPEALLKDTQQFGDRLDLTGIQCFTIDDISTKDMDDAISLERSRDGYRLGIHITDAASYITPASELDAEAKRRATSLYCPEMTVNMLPDELSEDVLSLSAGNIRLTLSCLLELDHRFAILRSEVKPSFLRVTRRCTYKEIDDLLYQSDSEFHTLYNIASSFEQKRIEKGALKGGKKEMLVTVAADGSLSLLEVDENSPARSLVAECMVLANTIFAEYGAANGLPLIYRGQSAPEIQEPSESEETNSGSAQGYTTRSKLKKSYTSVTPVKHSSLALDAYIQATSPIRRYADIINQRQILSHVQTGKGVHSAEDLEAILKEIEEPLGRAQAISKETKRFWLLRYLQELAKRDPIVHGVVLRTDLRTPLVEIQEVLMPTLVKFEQPVRAGDQVRLRICKIDPRNGFARFEFIAFI